jgi:hypothetical protein
VFTFLRFHHQDRNMQLMCLSTSAPVVLKTGPTNQLYALQVMACVGSEMKTHIDVVKTNTQTSPRDKYRGA